MIKCKKFGALLLSLALIFSLTACAGEPAPSTAPESSPESGTETSAAGASGEITDREGKTITIPEKVESIISMAPSITETLLNLGLGDKIVAVDTYSADREGLREGIPTFDMMTPDTERIAALKPDIIFATGMSMAGGEDPFKAVTDLGVLMTYIPSATSIQGIKEDLKFLGDITGTAQRAGEIIAKMEADMAAVTAKIPAGTGKTVYFEIAPAPASYSFGTGTFLNEMLELLGAKNVLADQESWVSVSEEVLLEKNPDVIFTNVGYTEAPVDEILGRKGWDAINAVKNKQVFQVATNSTSLPNENIVLGFQEMAKALYPDIFS